MSFTDYLFMPLFIIVAILYYILPKRIRWIFLLAISIAFYCSWNSEVLPYILVAVLLAWVTGNLIENLYRKIAIRIENEPEMPADEKKTLQSKTKKKCKWILLVNVSILVGMLVFSKAGKHILAILHMKGAVSVVMPLGISYYTMSLIGYMADVYWKKEKAEKNILKLLLFAIYFPKILEGPISKHRLIAKQLNESTSFDYNTFCFGLQRMIWGYFKKLVIADRLNVFITAVLANYKHTSGAILTLTFFFGVFQLYCDFSGCMDIVIGASETLGIKLEENFNHPFFSESAAEFWRRWHISLGAWFKDYVYMPIVISPRLIKISGKVRKKFGKRAGKAVMTVVPLLIVWSLTGIWHGTGWNYVVWGLYWGTLISWSTIFEAELKKINEKLKIDVSRKYYHCFRRIRTFLLFMLSRAITMPTNLKMSAAIFKRVVTRFAMWELVDGTAYTFGLGKNDFIVLGVALLILYSVSKKQENGVFIREEIAAMPLVVRWGIYFAAVFCVLIFGTYGIGYNASSFVYMNY